MDLDIQAHPGYLRVEIREEETAADARSALEAVREALGQNDRRALLVVVRASRPIFKVHEYGLEEALDAAAGVDGLRIALVADTPEMEASHEYVELLARQRGVVARTFRGERQALKWLLARG